MLKRSPNLLFSKLINLYSKQDYLKKILPLIFVIVLFQDVMAVNVGVFSDFGEKLIKNIDEFIILIGLPFIILYYQKRKWKIDFIGFIFLSILILGLISSLIHKVPLNIMFQGAILMLKGFLVLFIFRSISFTQNEIQKYIKLFKYVAVIVVLFAVIDILFFEHFRRIINTDHKFDYRMGVISIQSIFAHPSIYGWFLAVVGMYLLATFMIEKDKKSGYYSLIIFFASMFSFRFKTLMAIVFNAIFAGSLDRSFKNKIKKLRQNKAFIPIITIASLLTIIVLYAVIQLSILTIQRYITIDYTESARKALYIFGFVISIKEFPFGVGFGRYGSWTASEHYSPVYVEYGLDKIYGLYSADPKWATDTYWPSIMGEIGIVGALLMFITFIYLILHIYKGFKFIQNSSYRIFLLFTLMIVNQSLIESLGEQVYNSGPQYFFIFALVGISLSLIYENVGEVKLGTRGLFRTKLLRHRKGD